MNEALCSSGLHMLMNGGFLCREEEALEPEDDVSTSPEVSLLEDSACSLL